MEKIRLDPGSPQIKWIGVRFLDKLGPKFQVDGKKGFFRAIEPGLENHFEVISRLPSVQRCISKGYLEEERVSSVVAVEGYEMVLAQGELDSVSQPAKVPFERRVAMARLWLEINLILIEDGYGLVDAHIRNWGFSPTLEPRWIDFGSIVKLQGGVEGLSEFLSENLRPLALGSELPGLLDLLMGTSIGRKEALALRRGSLFNAIYRRVPILKRLTSDYLLQRILRRIRYGKNQSQSSRFRWRRRELLRLRASLLRLPSPAPQPGFWSSYRRGRPLTTSPENRRAAAIQAVIKQISPTSIADLGANDGWVVLQNLAASRELVAIEPDHAALSQFTSALSKVRIPEKCVIRAEIGSFGPLGRSYDLVIALALTHHLVISQGWSFKALGRTLSAQCLRYALVEFMPWGLVRGNATEPQPGLPGWYNDAEFVLGMKKYFYQVKKIVYKESSGLAPRNLYLLEKNPSSD